MRLEVTPIIEKTELPCRLFGLRAIEAKFHAMLPTARGSLAGGEARDDEDTRAMEQRMRAAALRGGERLLLGVYANPAVETSPGVFQNLYRPSPSLMAGLTAYAARGDVDVPRSFPVARLNGVSLPSSERVRLADPSCWFNWQGVWSASARAPNAFKFNAWDTVVAKGNHPRNFFHINTHGGYGAFGQSNHAAIGGAQLVQARQLRYLQIGGRVFLVVGVIIDGMQLGEAVRDDVEFGTLVPMPADVIRAGASWSLAWTGAKANIAGGLVGGVARGPGLAFCAIGGGTVTGVTGLPNSDWIADFTDAG